ncbi:MAG TPA: bifunctional phosphoribosylaminoimidazolecarboxamide formyltransferase/inosine monophosphate cyclohydrolase [Hungateiclostridium thermocellum]|uniref:Bifunctional purine biosynthesis protein PurH n=1 Tax=Acetivibrio thermocellus (strain ATCC 27405 / DSM 1237 / JCM 9322 / NBRC 103400 / NCIMB 10682 / NRRL B-4536 / VPI 7372) TaxID=203119 RepID=PUR9_ACET2|nr:bifunctional phosphoribosylaminoimidazolecarboxamide formyltransferase/IMP cyclohydrolase [Acetivibrio thermocellus]A3DEU9.1 RecName: Full=Bifunctional purine biosynthesis protein PurH; Includes: RecName: Full=Phosphoribosylaminoimidazolecarboxamide formyltransferase; AltName: Full=AICAR transformylase; Includes: RecName: Full=IMP cyclohydrolase; AltName: Full=ATIC; AltName: Full=IMP synthase; AltName: Full=Inosinicase [Acetivibrio thermocellus ATCC 27405]CDG35915.1 Bifunctional purine biosynt
MIKRALISVSDKTGIVEMARELQSMGVDIISTGGTAKTLSDAGIKVINISDVTGFPECLDGRVKTLHPKVHAGILAIRSNEEHMRQLKELNIETIDMVIINLYPFKQTILKENVDLSEAIENIDIGGPTMIRAAAKNYQDVVVIVDPSDYAAVLEELKTTKDVSLKTKFKLAYKVFEHTSHYDTLIAKYLREQIGEDEFPQTLSLTFEKVQDMRYGENPHQKAVFYKEVGANVGCITAAKQLHGKELSYNNINDANGAIEIIKEFDEPTVVAVKHANPCGVASASNIYDAYIKAYEADPVSIFGGIIAANREIDEKTAEEINKIFVEIVIAPSFTEGALKILTQKKNIRLLQLEDISAKIPKGTYDMKKVPGGLLVQNYNSELLNMDDLKVVTEKKPTQEELEDLIFAMKVVKHTKSNGIALAKGKQTIGVGPGQTNRVTACKIAIEYGGERTKGAVLASDAFFPFADCVEAAAAAGITAIIQPGGSIRDQESIDACNKYGIAMVFTGMRHFKH